MQFRDRHEAGEALAARLAHYTGEPNLVVLGIPRGGVIVAAEVAHRLGAPLDVWITRKLGAPGNPELALGAIAGDGTLFLDRFLLSELQVSPTFIEHERSVEIREIERRAAMYRQGKPPLEVKNQIVILCDDGVATGATTLVALRALRQRSPARLVLAVPVGPQPVIAMLSGECDEMVVLDTPDPFWAVGLFYDRFDQVGDAEVIQALRARTPE